MIRFCLVHLMVFVGCLSCVTLYEEDSQLTANVLVVEGTVTNAVERQSLRLGRSKVYNGTSVTTPVEGAKVEIVVNGGEVVSLPENRTAKGLYEAPEGFRGQVGNRYQLRLQLADGQRYESTAETLPAVPKMDKVYDKFDAAGIANAEKSGYLPAHFIYTDFQDPVQERNYYRWTWTLWENQIWCATCQQSLYNLNSDGLSGNCSPNPSLPRNNLYDYNCNGLCWEIIRGTTLQLFYDTYSNGRTVVGQQVAAIPYYQRQPALVEIRQTSLTPEAYQYYKLLENQSQRTGGLADTPPAPLIGNVRNVADERENVAGYFGASAVASTRYWLDRQNASGLPIDLFVSFNGRSPNLEPSTPRPPRPPLSVCIPGETRTPVKPTGWR